MGWSSLIHPPRSFTGLDTADLIWSDSSLRNDLKNFAWNSSVNQAKAQHAIELTEMGGGAAFEIILTAILAAVTGGVGAVASVASKARHMTKFKKLGELLVDFAKASKKLAVQAKERAKRAAKTAKQSFDDLKTDMPAADRKGEKPKAAPSPTSKSPQQLVLENLDEGNSLNGQNARKFIEEAKLENKINPYTEGLTDEEYLSLKLYTTNLYQPINNGLRGLSPEDLKKWKEVANNADSALEKLQETDLKYVGESFRGDQFDDSLLDKLFPENVEHIELGFKSTSSNPNRSFPGNTKIKITGKSGVTVKDISALPSEEEVLFRPGTKFKVKSKLKSGGTNFIELEEL